MLTVMLFVSIVDFMVLMPLAPQLMRELSITSAQFGLLIAAYSVAAAVSAIAVTALADRFDRRHSLLLCFLGLSCATAACGLVDSYPALLIARVVAGVFGGVLSPLALSIVGDLIPLPRRGRAMGIVMLGFSLAAVAGVPFGLMLANLGGWQSPFRYLAVISLIIALLAARIIPSVRGHIQQVPVPWWQGYREVLAVPNHWRAWALSTLVVSSSFLVIPFLSPALVANTVFSEAELPYVYLVGGLVTLISRPLIGQLSDRFRPQNVFTLVALLAFAPVLIVTATPTLSLHAYYLVLAFFFIFVSGRFIPCMAMVSASCESHMRGRVMTLSTASQSVGRGLATLTSGLIVQQASSGELVGYGLVGWLSCAVGALSILVCLRLRVVS